MVRFFGKKNPLDEPIEKLRDSQIRLDAQIRSIEKEIADIERQITQLFEEGKRAKSKSEELTIATRIKTLSQRKQNLQSSHMQLNKQMVLLSNLLVIKENERILKSTPLYDFLRKMSPEELEEKLTKIQLRAENLKENLSVALGYTERAIAAGYEEDEEIRKILETIRAVKEGELDPQSAAKKVERLEEKQL